jgi:hypothetical protein
VGALLFTDEADPVEAYVAGRVRGVVLTDHNRLASSQVHKRLHPVCSRHALEIRQPGWHLSWRVSSERKSNTHTPNEASNLYLLLCTDLPLSCVS